MGKQCIGMNGEKRWLLSVMAQRQVAIAGTPALSTNFSILSSLSRLATGHYLEGSLKGLSDASGGLYQKTLMSTSNPLTEPFYSTIDTSTIRHNQPACSSNFCLRAILCGTPLGQTNQNLWDNP